MIDPRTPANDATSSSRRLRRPRPPAAAAAQGERHLHPDETQGDEGQRHDQDVDEDRPRVDVGLAQARGGARDDGRQLFAEEHEHRAVERELDHVPDRGPPHPRGRQRPPALLGEGHGHPGGDRGEDTRGADRLGQKVGAEGQEQAHEDFRAGLLADPERDEVLQTVRRHGRRDARRDPGEGEPEEGDAGVGQREAARGRGDDGEAHADEAGGVVQQGLALEDAEEAPRQAGPLEDRSHRHRIGRREDGGEGEGDRQRHRRDHPVDEKADADDGEDDEPEGEVHDGAKVAEEPVLGDAPAVDEEQRRQEEQEEDVGVEAEPEVGCCREHAAEGDLDERERHRRAEGPRQPSAGDDGDEQHQRRDDHVLQGRPPGEGWFPQKSRPPWPRTAGRGNHPLPRHDRR